MFAVLDPARAAGCDQRQSSAVLDSLKQFRAFFQDSQIGSRIRIEYLVKSQTQHSAYHLLCRSCTDRHTEFFANGSSYRRSRLNENDLLGICDGRPYLIDGALFCNSAYRTGNEALTAVYAGNFTDSHAKSRSDRRIEASVNRIDNTDFLNVLAGSYATSAGNTLLRISHERRGRKIHRQITSAAVKSDIGDIEFICESLQFAVLASRTRETFSLRDLKEEVQRLTLLASLYGW